MMNVHAGVLQIICSFFVLFAATLHAGDQTVSVHATPPGYPVDSRITMTVNGQSIPVLQWTTGTKPYVEYLYVRFAVSGEAVVKITCDKPIESHQVQPAAFAIVPNVNGQDMTFTLSGSRYFIVTINRIMLMVLADPPEVDAPRPGGAGVHVLPKSADAKGEQNCTDALQGIIDAAGGHEGGGVAYIPRGTYKVGPFRLLSNVTLYLEDGAALKFDAATTAAAQDFGKVIHRDHERVHPGIYFIKADDAQNIRIAGRGIIDLNGGAYFEKDGWLNSCMRIQNVSNFSIEGVTIRENSSWSVLPAGCDGVRIQNVKVLNGMGFEQNDAFDIISCRDVRIEHCFGYGRDDIYCLKAGGRGTHGGGITTSSANAFGNITVKDCVAYTRDGSGFKMGNQSRVSGEDFTCKDLYVIAGRNGAFLALFDGPATFQKIRIDQLFVETKNIIPFKVVIKKGGQVKDLAVTNVFREMQPVPISIAKDMQALP